jgi:phosphoenolpyruvate carboxykinase (GTP)
MIERIEGLAASVESPVGRVPAPGAIDFEAAGVSADDWARLFAIDADAHLAEADDAERFFDSLGPQVPDAVRAQLAETRRRLRSELVTP